MSQIALTPTAVKPISTISALKVTAFQLAQFIDPHYINHNSMAGKVEQVTMLVTVKPYADSHVTKHLRVTVVSSDIAVWVEPDHPLVPFTEYEVLVEISDEHSDEYARVGAFRGNAAHQMAGDFSLLLFTHFVNVETQAHHRIFEDMRDCADAHDEQADD